MCSCRELEQQIFVLSMLSNTGAFLRGDAERTEKKLRKIIETVLVLSEWCIGKWTLVWGPAVFQVRGSKRADNVMYVARKEADGSEPAQLVIAIAGTNVLSMFDILIEDFAIVTQVPWEYGTPPEKAKISLGTFHGFSILQQVRPGPDVPGDRKPIREFLAKQTSEERVHVTVAGHSLGGALSPTLALWLSDTRKEWDPKSNAILDCLPSAGPTPGNRQFAEYYDQQFKERQSKNCTKHIYNKLDVVSYVWATSDIEKIPTLYKKHIKPDDSIEFLTECVKHISKPGDYAQIPNPAPFEGTVNRRLIFHHLSPLENFLVQALYQHTLGYAAVLDIKIPDVILEPIWRTLNLEQTAKDVIAALHRRFPQ